MTETLDCPSCGTTMEYEGRGHECHSCNNLWVAHNLSVTNRVREYQERRRKESKAYKRNEARKKEQSRWYRFVRRFR